MVINILQIDAKLQYILHVTKEGAMKLFLVSILTITLFGLGSIAKADNRVPSGQLPPTNPNTRRLVSTIDGIDVPYDVLNYIQTEYMGHTVTQANKIERDGRQAYRLRVDRDDLANDYESFYLIYDSSWKLISGKEKIQPPPPPPAPKPVENTQRSGDRDDDDDKEERRRRRGRDDD